MEAVILIAGAKILKSVPDCFIFHRGNPKTLHGLTATGKVVHAAEDQLSLTACVAGVDNGGYILPAHQRPQNVKLVPLILGNTEPEGSGDDGQIRLSPLGIPGIIVVRIGKASQMPEAPGYDIAASLQIAISAKICADHLGDALSNRRFFSDYKLHISTSIDTPRRTSR